MAPRREEGADAGRRRSPERGPAQVLLDLARDEALRRGDRRAALMRIAEAASTALACERVGIWLYDEDRSAIRCAELFQRGDGSHSEGLALEAADFPAYFAALESERTIAAHDAPADSRTREFRSSYLEPLGISSMLDAPIRLGGAMMGVVCHEHVGEPRRWSSEEEAFAGSIADFVALALEHADRREAERELVESRERERLLLDSTAEGIYGVDLAGNCSFCNRTCLDVLGYDHESDLLGRNVHDLVHDHGETPGDGDCLAFRAQSTGLSVHSRDQVFVRADGERVPVELRAQPIRRDGRIVGAVVSFLDISRRLRDEREKRQLEERFQDAQRLESLAKLAGGVAHDFNNMLQSVIANLDEALEESGEEQPERPRLEQASLAALRAAELAQQLLDYSGRGSFVLRPTCLRELVAEMLELLRSSLPRDTQLELSLPEELPAVQADATQLRQVLMNLVLNASDALEGRPGRVEVELGQRSLSQAELESQWTSGGATPGSYVVLRVRDEGCGMDAETRNRIFDPFFTTKFAGRGLGLAAVLGIVRGHGGVIRVSSEVGRGSEFEVALPPTEQQARPSAAEPRHAVAQGPGPLRILVVDDDPAVRRAASRILERAGHQVVTAADGKEAVDRVAADELGFGLVLLDLTMPVLSGQDALQGILRLRPETRVLLSSGYSESDMQSRIREPRPAGFIQKPYRPAALLAKIAELVDA